MANTRKSFVEWFSFWQNAPSHWAEFDSAKQAQAAIDAAVESGDYVLQGRMAADVANQNKIVGPLSKATAIKRGMPRKDYIPASEIGGKDEAL